MIFKYIEDGKKKGVAIDNYQAFMDSMTDDEFIDFMIAAYSEESMALRNESIEELEPK